MSSEITISIYAVPLIFLIAWFTLRNQANQRKLREMHRESKEAGLTEAASLHPVINPALCIGCGSCASACPEHDVLGVIGGKAQLINPADCIGHGACQRACPADAIELVFGSARRGVDIPAVTPEFESSQSGIFIAGELGGMGLIRNAIEQGRQAMEAVVKSLGKNAKASGEIDADVIVIGAGPAGISASLQACEAGIRCLTLDQDSLGGTVAHFPKGKLVMTQPAILPTVGKIKFSEIQKEELLAFWEKVISEQNLKINFNEWVSSIERTENGFRVSTPDKSYTCSRVLLTIGRRGSPRKLDVPGEDLSKVVYRMVDPAQYEHKKVLVVGGGDSALEAACSIAELGNPDVTLCYRGSAFSRAKGKNRKRVGALTDSGTMRLLLETNPLEITPETVVLEQGGESIELENDAVIICAGGILPFGFLKDIGIEIQTKYGTQ